MSDTGKEPELRVSARIGRCARIGGGLSTKERSKVGMQALSPAHTPYSATNAWNQIRNKAALVSRFRSSTTHPPVLGASYFISGSHSIKGRCSIAFSSTTFHNAVS